MTTFKRLTGIKRGVFAPTDIAGLQGWWDFSDATKLYTDAGTTLVTADADAVYQINDKSGNANHAVQSTLANRALYKTGIQNGHSVGRFDGTNDYYSLTSNISATTGTIAAVASNNGGTSDRGLLVMHSLSLYSSLGGSDQWGTYRNSAHPFGSAMASMMTAVTTHTATDWYLYGNGGVGVTGADAVNNSRGASAIAADPSGVQFHKGDIAELLVYSPALSLANLNTLGAYLASKWGLTWTTAT